MCTFLRSHQSSPFEKGGHEGDLESRHFILPQIPPHSPFAKGGYGFTLLEMLVALVVASIMLTVATLQLMPSAQSVLREEAQRLAFLLENGAMASQAGGQALAWSGTGNSYRFWNRTREGEWVRIERDNLLHPRSLPEAVSIGEVSFNGRRIDPGSLVVLSPELSAKDFRVSLRSGELVTDVVGNGLGKVEVVAGKLQ